MSAGSFLAANGGLIAGGGAIVAVAVIVGIFLTADDKGETAAIGAGITPPASLSTEQQPVAAHDTSTTGTPVSDANDAAKTDPSDAPVSATVIGDTVVAAVDPDAPVVDGATVARPNAAIVDPSMKPAFVPGFDLVRVDAKGGAVIAGKAAAFADVDIVLNNTVIATVKADARGGFVALFDLPAGEGPQAITLRARDPDGGQSVSEESVYVVAPDSEATKPVVTAEKPAEGAVIAETATEPATAPPPEPVAPAIVIAGKNGTKLVQPAGAGSVGPDVMANVSLDIITYDQNGEVQLSGRGTADQHVRIYVNDQAVKTEPVDKDGAWHLSLPEVSPGTYTLRVDELNAGGHVTSRVQTPFKKEAPEAVRQVANSGALGNADASASLPRIEKITIQPGATLWAVAKANYGDGRMYLQIFRANRDTIRNPNLIFPGQIFTIPE